MKFLALLLILCSFMFLSCGQGTGTRGAVEGSAAIVSPPGQLPIVTEPITMTLGLRQSPNVHNYDTNHLTTWMEEQTGIKTTFHVFSSVASDSNTQFELMVSAGEKLPDIMLFPPGDWQLHGDNGVFIDLRPFFRDWAYFYNQRLETIPAIDASRIELRTTAPSGNRYAWAMYSQQPNMSYRSMNWINETWLNRLGLPMPTTTDEFYNTMVAFRDRNPSGTGIATIPYIGGPNFSGEPIAFLINAFVLHPYRDHGNFFLNATDGRLWTPWTTEEYREALRYINRMYSENLFHPSTFTNTTAELGNIVSYMPGETGRVGFFSGINTQILLPETPAIFDFTFQPPLRGPRGQNNYPMMPNRVNPESFITRDAAYPEAAFRWLDFGSSVEATMVSRSGIPNVDWRWTRPEEGAISFWGTPAQIHVNNVIWAAPQNSHWQIEPFQMYVEGINSVLASWEDDGTFLANRFKMYQTFEERVARSGALDASEHVETILYTAQELNDIREIRSSIDTYREESRALFITGALNLDRDWDNYLQTLDRMGLQRYMEIAQRAYTRTMQMVR